jgi:Tol biopolymer transport system component
MRARKMILPAAVICAALSVAGPSRAESPDGPEPNHEFVDKIVVASDRHAPTLPVQINNGELYLINLDGSGEQRLTNNNVFDGFGTLSPDGKRIVFDSNRNRLAGEPVNTSGLFVMNADGTDQTFLARGGSPSWSPDGKYIAFHASASGTALPIKPDPGAATFDSDIFVVNVDDLLEHGTPPRNLTNTPASVDDDPDWSPDGNWIVYTSHDASQRPVPPMPLDYTTAEIYVRAADGTGSPTRLTNNSDEERAPNWSHQGDRISYMCRAGSPRFKICVMNADGTAQTQLTLNDLGALTPAWSPDDAKIFFHRPMPEPGTSFVRNQLWWVASDGSTEQLLVPSEAPTGSTLFADVGVLRVKTNR